MTEETLDRKFLSIVDPAIASAVGAAVVWLTGGSGYLATALTTFLAVAGGISALIFSMMYRRYLGVLASGGARKGSPSRAAYDALRASLSGGNIAARIYIQRLRALLDWLERFFGDAGMADRTLFPHFFGLRTPAPLWTVPAFDRCLLLALIYPIVTIVLIWVISGHIGPAEAALHPPRDTSGWQRAAGMVLIFLSCYAWSRGYRAGGWVKKFSWFAFALALASAVAGVFAAAVAVAGALAVAGFFARFFAGVFGFVFAAAAATTAIVAIAAAGAGATVPTIAVAVALAVTVAIVVAVAGAYYGALAFSFAFAIAVAIAYSSAIAGAFVTPIPLALAAAITFAAAFAFAVASAVAFAAAFALVVAGAFAITSGQQSWTFLAVLLIGLLALIIGIPALLASGPAWTTVGPLLLFIGLLTVINAPFDWVSLGLTRALLRRGLELGGWWPYFFALTDAALAAVIITFLAAAMVIGVQAFDTVTIHSGGERVLPLKELFDGVAARPSEPEYWWLYALLVSSMLPSILNLAIGGVAFLRGVPGLPSTVLDSLPAGKAVAPFNRAWIALTLTVQTFLGAGLGVAAQAALAVGVIGYGLPWLGFHVLDGARDIANFNLPERVWALFVG